MTEFGYTMMCEQSPPDALVADIRRAEEAGFDFSVISDHFQPWLVEQGHSPYAWSVLGAAAAVTERIGLMTYVTCPTVRYHPAIVAQKAATMQILSGGRFRLGLGAGENLNEHVVGDGWPAVGTRHSMLSEAVDVIGALFDADDGEAVSYHGEFFDLETARLWDRHEQRVPIAVAVSGEESCELAGRKADLMIAVEPKAELGEMFDAAGGAGKGIKGADLVADDRLKGEWDVVVVGPHFAGAFVARDLGDAGADAERHFEYFVTYDRERVTAAAQALLRHLIRDR